MKNLTLCLLLVVFWFGISAQNPDTLVIGYNIIPPFVTEEHGELSGPSVWLWEKIAEEHQIPCVYKKMPLESLLSKLSAGEIDLSLSPLTITHGRSEVMDFSSPYYVTHATILVKDISYFDQLLDFVRSVLSIHFFRALGALAFVILIFGFMVWIFERKHNKEEFGHGWKGLWSGFWWSAVTMTTVGYGDKSPRTSGGRIIALIWMFTVIIIISGFTAGIASSLTVNQISASADKIADFKKKNLGTMADSGTDHWLIHNFYTNKTTFGSLEQMITALYEGQIDAIAYDRPILQYLVKEDSLNDLTLLDIKYNPQFYAIGMSKDLPVSMQDRINLSMLEITEEMNWKLVLAEFNLY
jgi:ABC-type amino acid transport substrate-binding protein